ncbi:protein-ADP-ribose hydrolase [Lentzea sp. NPDC060358]|uniref:protein-ADP-ribose hydrolase n=1 Tax=Lentzea sp. NPDC060358 TaxID=3347103 RepID=UPI0036461EE5
MRTEPLPPPGPAQDPGALTALALRLLGDDPWTPEFPVPGDAAARRRVLRAVLNVRGPAPMDPGLLGVLDAVLDGERRQRPVTDVSELPAPVSVWHGDITRLAADAVVNAANDALLGCFQPLHDCVDNAIHSAAGPRLREECHRIMSARGRPEPTGTATLTPGYHLPAPFVLHTVGPIVRGPLSAGHEAALARSYRACLDLAAEVPRIRSVAFCGIGTGVFGFPKGPAARIAVATVRDWLAARPGRLDRVVFVAFTAEDLEFYRELR